jgi:hypothetical protein
MTGAALATRLRPALGAVARGIDAVVEHVVVSLAVLVAVQIALTVVLFTSVAHNGWLTYQGGDQLWLVTTGWLLGQGVLPYALVGYGWPVLMAPLTWLSGASSLDLLPHTTVLQVAVLGPIATLAVYDIGARLAGRLAGLWCAGAWVLAPYVGSALFVDRYQERFTEQVVVQMVGLTQLADYPSTVLVLVAAALVLRSLAPGAVREAALAGAVAGLALGVKPANALFLAGPVLAYLVARRWRAAATFGVMLLPAAALLSVWKYRGTGEIPLLALGEVHVATSMLGDLPIGNSFLERFPLSLDDWERNMSNLREFFWSARLAQWAPVAGAIAVARLSRPAAALLLGWLLGFVLVKGASPLASIESGSFWRLVMPAFPAYVILTAAIPLLVPTALQRLGRRVSPATPRRPGRRTVVAVATVLFAVPAAFVAAASPGPGGAMAMEVNGILVPVDGATVQLRTRKVGAAQHLRWSDSTSPTTPFYRVYRTAGAGTDTHCELSTDRCSLDMILLGTTRARSWVDGSPEPGVTYRIGVAANWVDDPEQGDVMLISPPVRAAA